MRVLLQVCLVVMAGCRADADWDGTFYSCEEGQTCPPGYTCGADGHCVAVAAQPPLDGPRPPDAPAPPDAADPSDGAAPPPPDAPVVLLTATFGERPTADFRDVTRDTFLAEDSPTNNHGVHDDFHVVFGAPIQLGLMRFDLSGLPAGVTIVSAELRLFTDGDVDAPLEATSRLQAFRVLEDWQEGTGEFTPGQANWTERLPGTNWTTPGCGAPGSRDPALLGETAMAANDSESVIAIPPSVIQGWAADAGSNHGFALTAAGPSGSDYGYAVTREFGVAERRPLLSVTYQAPP